MQDSILPGDYVVSESSGIQNCEDDSQFGMEHEIDKECDEKFQIAECKEQFGTEHENDEECDIKLEMTECKEQDDEVSSCHEVVAMV